MNKKNIIWALRLGNSIKKQINLGGNYFIIKVYPNGEVKMICKYKELKEVGYPA